MKQVDEIIYDAIRADSALMEAIGNRVVSTCFEVSPDEKDNTPVPYIIVTDDISEIINRASYGFIRLELSDL